MNLRPLALIAPAAVALAILAARIAPAAEPEAKSHKLANVSLRKLADSLRAVIVADRDAYLAQIVEAPGAEPNRLPAHATLTRRAAQAIQQQGAEFSYTLRSLAPMQERNGPQTPAEKDGLERLTRRPSEPVYVDEELGGRSYFTAIYADAATRDSCVTCHNRSPHSPRQDYKAGDVLGALIIRLPLEF